MNLGYRFKLMRDYPSFMRWLPNLDNNYHVVRFLPCPLPQKKKKSYCQVKGQNLARPRPRGVVVTVEIEASMRIK